MPQTRAMRSLDLGRRSLRASIICGTEPWRTVGDLELTGKLPGAAPRLALVASGES